MFHRCRFSRGRNRVKPLLNSCLVVLVVLIVLAFVGVEPLKMYKDTALNRMSAAIESIKTELFSANLPFSLDIKQSNVFDSIVYLNLVATSNNKTDINKMYYVRSIDDNDGGWFFKFSAILEQKMIVGFALSNSSTASLLAQVNQEYNAQLEDARHSYESAVEKLAKHDARDEEIFYDFWWGRGVPPSLNTIREREQTRKNLLYAIDNATIHLANIQDKQSLVITTRDLLPYISIGVVEDFSLED